MSNNNAFFDDLSKLASGTTGAMMDMKREIDAMIASQLEGFAGKMNIVSREEFEIVKAMAEKARSENDALKARISALEDTKAPKKSTVKSPKNGTKAKAKK